MTVDSEFNLWSSGCINRTHDVSPFSRASDQSLGPLGLPASSDQLFGSGDAANASDLLAALQQRQHSAEEQNIDAQIERLLHMKQVLHRQKQLAPQQTMPIFEDEPLLVQRSMTSTLTMQSSASSASLCQPPLALEPSLPLDGNALSPMPSSTLDVSLASQDWAWAAGAAAAAHATQQPVRHSIDLGGLAHRLGAFELAATSHSFAQQQSVAAAAAAAAASAAAAAAALATTPQSPFCGSAFAPVATSSRQSIDLLAAQSAANRQSIDLFAAQSAANRQSMDMLAASRQSMDLLAASRQSMDLRATNKQSFDLCAAGRQSVDLQACSLSAANLALQSALYMPTVTQGMEPGALSAMHHTAVAPVGLNRPAPRIPTGRMSLDVAACSSLYSSTAAALAGGLQQQPQVMALPGQHNALRFAGAGSGRACASINTNQRPSIDVPLSRTPDGRCPPRKSCSLTSSSSTSSSRNSPTGTSRQQNAFAAAGSDSGPSQRGGRQPIHQAPKWAGSHWHPMADVVKTGQIQNKGTGVFLPPGMKKLADEDKANEEERPTEEGDKGAEGENAQGS